MSVHPSEAHSLHSPPGNACEVEAVSITPRIPVVMAAFAIFAMMFRMCKIYRALTARKSSCRCSFTAESDPKERGAFARWSRTRNKTPCKHGSVDVAREAYGHSD